MCTPRLSVEASRSLAPQGWVAPQPCPQISSPTSVCRRHLHACNASEYGFAPFHIRLSPTHEPNNLCRSTEIANMFHPALIKPMLRICMHLQKTIFSINKLCTLDSVILPTIRFCDNKKSAVIQLVDFFFRNYYAPDPCLLSQDRALQMKLPLRPFVRVLGS